VAIVGSIAATSYRPKVGSKLAGLHLSASAISSAKGSVGGAIDLAKTLPTSVGGVVVATAKLQYVHGLRTALLVATGVVLAAAAIVLIFLPARAGDAREPVEGPLDGLASLTYAEAEGALEEDQLLLEAESTSP